MPGAGTRRACAPEQRDTLRQVGHRPFPLPPGPWVLGQTWSDPLFAHWPLDPAALRRLLPSGVELDLFDGRGWLGVTPFLLSCFRPRGLPALPRLSRFPEVNVRTYVTVAGRPGLWFFSLDAPRLLAVAGARAGYGVPYYAARMSFERAGDEVRFESERLGAEARVDVRYRPVGPPERPRPEGLEAWLTERYRTYTARRGRVLAVDIHHAPWRLAAAEAEFRVNTITEPLGVPPAGAPLVHYAPHQPVVTWLPRRL